MQRKNKRKINNEKQICYSGELYIHVCKAEYQPIFYFIAALSFEGNL